MFEQNQPSSLFIYTFSDLYIHSKTFSDNRTRNSDSLRYANCFAVANFLMSQWKESYVTLSLKMKMTVTEIFLINFYYKRKAVNLLFLYLVMKS